MAWRLAGEPELQLPSLKRLARQRLVATRCLTASTHFVPDEASWLKGLWPSEFGIKRNAHFSHTPSSPRFVQKLRQQGWRTALIDKAHWHPHAEGAIYAINSNSYRN